MTCLSDSFLAATRLALGLPSTAMPQGPQRPVRCKPHAAASEQGPVSRYPDLTPPRSWAPGRSAGPCRPQPSSSQSCR